MKKERKHQSKNFRFTLAVRVISVSFALLIIPLIFHLIWMYQHDYFSRKKDLFLSLNILAESRSTLIDQIISSKIDFLELTNKNPIFYEPVERNQKSNELDDFLKMAASEIEVSEIFYIASNDKQFKCLASSTPKLIDKPFVDYSFITGLLGKERFALFGVLPFINERRLIIGKAIYDKNTQRQIGIFVAAIEAPALAYRLAAIEDSPYVIDLSLIMKGGIIFASSDPNLALRSIDPLSASYIQNLRKSGQIGDLKIYADGLGLEPIPDLLDAFQITAKEKNFAVFSPVKDTNIKIALDVSEELFFSLQQREFLTEIMLLLFLIFVIGGVGAYILIRRFSKPYNNLQYSMQKVTKGDFSARYKPDKMGFEINAVGDNFNHMIESIIKHEKKATEERLAKEILANELKIGYEIQMSMLPSEIPELSGLDIATGFIPAKEVGGDFYDLFTLKDGKVIFAIADAAGKGISACLYSLSLRSMLRSFCTSSQNLHEVIKKANELFMKDTKDTGIFVTLWLGIYDPKTHTLQYCNAGHHPPYIKRESKLVPLKTEGMALGVLEIDHVDVKEIELKKGDQIILFTDGVIDVENKQNEFFKESSLVNVLQKTEGSSQNFIDSILKEINTFRDGMDLPDDLTIVAIRML